MTKYWHPRFWLDLDDALPSFEADRGRLDVQGLLGKIMHVNDIFILTQVGLNEDTIVAFELVTYTSGILVISK